MSAHRPNVLFVLLEGFITNPSITWTVLCTSNTSTTSSTAFTQANSVVMNIEIVFTPLKVKLVSLSVESDLILTAKFSECSSAMHKWGALTNDKFVLANKRFLRGTILTTVTKRSHSFSSIYFLFDLFVDSNNINQKSSRHVLMC